MIDLPSILNPRCARVRVNANSRKRLLEYASDLLAEHHPEFAPRALFDSLMSRERLGSTALGDGVAIPHCRMPCDQIVGACVTLKSPVDYDAIDGEPVDLLFVLVVPPEETNAHLELLAALARLFGDSANRAALRNTKTDAEFHEQLVGMFSSQAA